MSEREPRAFGYGRASTKKQVESPEVQKQIIKEYAAFHKLGDVTYFIDVATSAKIPWEQRDAGKMLMSQIRRGDHIVITKLDRAFRKLSDCVFVLEKFERMGIKLHVCSLMGGAIDLSSPMGRFLIHILAAFAELERAFISERTKEALANKKRTGFSHTRFPGYGFRWEKRRVDGKIQHLRVVDHEEREVMKSIAMWRMQDQPLSWDEIRQHLNYNLQLKTKDGKQWDDNRIRRACKAEFMLQLKEQRNNR